MILNVLILNYPYFIQFFALRLRLSYREYNLYEKISC